MITDFLMIDYFTDIIQYVGIFMIIVKYSFYVLVKANTAKIIELSFK